MTENNKENLDNNKWLSPIDAAKILGLTTRQIYRLVSLGKLESKGEKRDMKVSPESLELYKRNKERRNMATKVINATVGQESFQESQIKKGPSNGELKNSVALQIITLQAERERLQLALEQTRLNELTNIKQIGHLESKVEQLERQLNKLEFREKFLVWLALALIVVLVLALVLIVLVLAFLK